MDNTLTPHDWSISGLWNDLVVEERRAQPRDYIRASEIGKPYLDRYLAMKGIPYSNQFPARVLRIFDSGRIFETLVIERIFKLLGILIESQGELKIQKDGMLPVVGHHDPLVGGKVDMDLVEKNISNEKIDTLLDLVKSHDLLDYESYSKFLDGFRTPEWVAMRTREFAKKIMDQYPNGLKPMITEIKTVNSLAFWAPKNKNKYTNFFNGYLPHKLQLFTYLLASSMPEGRLFYISKDDLTLMEVAVFRDDAELMEIWTKDIAGMTEVWNKGVTPKPDPYIVFNEQKKIWEPNWMIARSNYFTFITGFTELANWKLSLSTELKQKNSAECRQCKKTFSLITLNKNDGLCGRCIKTIGKEIEEGGEINE